MLETWMHPESDFKLAINQKNDNDITIFQYKVIVILFNVVLFLLSSLVTGPSFISISALFLELWQFAFYIDQKSRNWKYPRLCFGMDASNEMLLNAAKCQEIIVSLLNVYTPLKKKYLRTNHANFVTNELRKAIM